MEQISSNKLVSLHLQKCSGRNCSNASVCYHMKKEEVEDRPYINTYEIKKEISTYYKVHEAVCHYEHQVHKRLLKEFPTYNMTVSCNSIHPGDTELYRHRDQIQVSVYDKMDVSGYIDYQKLFLIKDEASIYLAYELMKIKTGKLHYIIDQEFLSSAGGNPSRRIVNFMMGFERRVDSLQSADTCLTSWIINGKCPYNSYNYIDLNHDLTLRKCPYTKKSIASFTIDQIETRNIIAMLNGAISYYNLTPECVYAKIFKGDMDGRVIKDSNLQNSSTNSGNGSGPKRMRRLSLRY